MNRMETRRLMTDMARRCTNTFLRYIQMDILRATLPSSVLDLEVKLGYFLWNLFIVFFCVIKIPKFETKNDV